MLKILMKNAIDENNSKENEKTKIDNNKEYFQYLNRNTLINTIPKLYQKKKITFLSKTLNRENLSSFKDLHYKKIFQSKILPKSINYLNFNDKGYIINHKNTKNDIINKSNINSISTTNNTNNNNTLLNNTNNSAINIMNNNLINNNIKKSRIYHNKCHNKNNYQNNIYVNVKIESDEDTNINDFINEEIDENIPVHVSNYNGGLKGKNRDWGFSKTDIKENKMISKEKIIYEYNNNILYHNRKNENKLKYNTSINEWEKVKKKLLYDDKRKDINKENKEKNNINKQINFLKINTINNNITSPNINNSPKIKRLNFDQPFRCITMSNSNKDIKSNKINKIKQIPRLTIDLTNLKNKINNKYININNNVAPGRYIEKVERKLNLFKSLENKNKNNQNKENSFNKYITKKSLLSPNVNILINKNNYNNNNCNNNNNSNNNNNCNNNLFNKYTHIKLKKQTNRNNKPSILIHSYTIKRHRNNKNFIINHTNNSNNNKNLNDFIFDIGNIKFKHYIENFLDNKSLMSFSSLNKDYYKNFRYVLYNKYYNYIILGEKYNKDNINKIIKSLLKYSCNKLKNKSKEEIEQIYKSFNYKSVYNESIIKDLTRTFPNDKTFNKNSLRYYKLYNILTVYSNFNKQIGYAQGLNFMSAIGLCLFDKEQEVFVFLDGLINRFELGKYISINNNLINNLKYFSNILHKYVDDIISFFDNKLVNHEFFSTNWILTLFSNCMNKNCLVVIWSFMIIFGWKFFYCFTIELLKFNKGDILKTEEKELNFKMKNLLNNDKFEKNLNLIIKNTFQLMKNRISL